LGGVFVTVVFALGYVRVGLAGTRQLGGERPAHCHAGVPFWQGTAGRPFSMAGPKVGGYNSSFERPGRVAEWQTLGT